MPSARRIRFLTLTAILSVLILVYITTARASTQNSPFYRKTVERLDRISTEKAESDAQSASKRGTTLNELAEGKLGETHEDGTPVDSNQKTAPKGRDNSPGSSDRIEDAKKQEMQGVQRDDTMKERLRVAELEAKRGAQNRWKDQMAAAKIDMEKAKSKAREAAGQVKPGANVKPEPEKKADKDKDKSKENPPKENAAVPKQDEEKNKQQKRGDEAKASVPDVDIKNEAEKVVEAVKENVGSPGDTEGLRVQAQNSPDTLKLEAELKREAEEARLRAEASVRAEHKERLKGQEMQRLRQAGLGARNPEWKDKEQRVKAQEEARAEAERIAKEEARKEQAKRRPFDPEYHSAEEIEFNRLIAVSPVTIFSKSYCPYSRKAKRILQQAFHITPLPYVVELDQHKMGQQIQDLLSRKTGRKTVPNVIVTGKSIGGGDDIEKMWERRTLQDHIKRIAGKRISNIIEDADILAGKKSWSH